MCVFVCRPIDVKSIGHVSYQECSQALTSGATLAKSSWGINDESMLSVKLVSHKKGP